MRELDNFLAGVTLPRHGGGIEGDSGLSVVCAYAYWRTRANVVAPNAFRYLEVK
jgi:hypothetical protein